MSKKGNSPRGRPTKDPYGSILPVGREAPLPRPLANDADELRRFLDRCVAADRWVFDCPSVRGEVDPDDRPPQEWFTTLDEYFERFPHHKSAGVIPGGLRAALALMDLWKLPEARRVGAAEYHACSNHVRMGLLYAAVCGSVHKGARRWMTPLPWSVLRPAAKLPWVATQNIFGDVLPLPRPKSLEAIETFLSWFEQIRQGAALVEKGSKSALAWMREHAADIYNFDAAPLGEVHRVILDNPPTEATFLDRGDQILPARLLRKTAADVASLRQQWDQHQAHLDQYLAGSRWPDRPQNVALIGTIAAQIAIAVSKGIGERGGKPGPLVKEDWRAKVGVFRIEVRERTAAIIRAVYNVEMTLDEVKARTQKYIEKKAARR